MRCQYYEVAYDEKVRAGESFGVVDITGLKWVEMDDHEDYKQAQEFFGGN